MRGSKTWSPIAPLVVLLVLGVASCGGADPTDTPNPVGGPPAPDLVPVPGETPNDPPPGGGPGGGTLSGGVLVTLVDRGEQFHIWVTDPTVAQAVVDIWNGKLVFNNITGLIRVGSGLEQHNAPWSWHLDPASVKVNISTFAPVYAGKPSEVEANLTALVAANQDKMTGNDGGNTLRNVQDLRSQAPSATETPAPR